MNLKYTILLSIIASSAYFLYQDKSLQTKLISKFHQIAPKLKPSTLYKWQNHRGEWQITDKPPKKGTKFTTVTR